MPTAKEVTYAHIARVSELLGMFAIEMIERGNVHDKSKFDPEELVPLEKMQALVEREGQAPFGTEEYERRKAMLAPMLEHHYANNTHHPEHHQRGVNGMDLFDLVEMFFDWKAASERGEEDAMNLSYSVKKYELSSQLEDIFTNTAHRLGYPIK